MPRKMIKKGTFKKIYELVLPKIKRKTTSNAKIARRCSRSPFPTLEDGNVTIEVWGTMGSEKLIEWLYRENHTERIQLTLTPICNYQIKQKWPEPPFVNVNLFNSKATEKNNWIGYIGYQYPEDINLEEMVREQGNLNVWASLHHRDGRPFVKLHLNSKYQPSEKDLIRTYISHDKKQLAFLEKLSVNTGKDYIQTDVEIDAEQKHYIFSYNGTTVGSATLQKIDKNLAGQGIGKAFLRIAQFRFNENSDNKHYSTLVILAK